MALIESERQGRLRPEVHEVLVEVALQLLQVHLQQAHHEDLVLKVAIPSNLALRAKQEEGLQPADRETSVHDARIT